MVTQEHLEAEERVQRKRLFVWVTILATLIVIGLLTADYLGIEPDLSFAGFIRGWRALASS